MTTSLSNLPGVVVAVSATAPANSVPTDTGTAFVAGLTLAGPTNVAVPIHSMTDFVNTFGNRDTGSLLYDSCDVAFRSGANTIYVGREVGPTPVLDSIALKDSTAATSVTVNSIGPTSTGWKVAVIAGTAGSTVVIQVFDANTNLLTQSPNIAVVADAVAWGKTNGFVNVVAGSALIPIVAASTALAGGTDDRTHIDYTATAVRQAALTQLFPKLLGPGQIAYPGITTEGAHVALANVASLTNRVALLDMADTSVASTIVSQRITFLDDQLLLPLAETYAAHLAGWQTVPGVNGAPSRSVPPSGFWIGLIAAQDALTGNPNVPAAGASGVLTYSMGQTQPEWNDADRASLNANGINVIRNVFGTYRIYGYRSSANTLIFASAAWSELSNVRMRMRIVNDLDIIGEDYIFQPIDGKGQTIAAFNGAVAGRMTTYWSLGALYGKTAPDAFTVVTASPVNTPATAQAQQLNVLIGAKFSPFAEQIYFGFTKQAITEG